MTILHILRSEPSPLVRKLIAGMDRGASGREFPVHQGAVDYDQLVRAIFESDRVVCWW
jgi:hypothetical protein